MRSRIRIVLCLATFALAFVAYGCSSSKQSAQTQLDRATLLFGATSGALNDAHDMGVIDERLWHNSIVPSARIAYRSIKSAEAALARGETSTFEQSLAAAQGALQELARWKAQYAKPTTRPAG